MKIEFFMCDAAKHDHVANTRDYINSFISDEDAIVHSTSTTFATMQPDEDHADPWTMMTVTVLYQSGPETKETPSYRIRSP